MCGRFTLNLAELADLKLPLGLDYVEITEWAPRYNIAPTQLAPVVVQNGSRVLRALRWGLVPHWAKDPSIGNRMINARVESIAAKPAFRDAFRRHRCVVPATGYYEWQPVPGEKRKQPHWFHPERDELLSMAGLWDRWRAPDGQLLESFTVVTTAANDLVAPIHDRMPLTLPREDREAWLRADALSESDLAAMTSRARDLQLAAYPVDRRVSSAGVDDPSCIAPANPEPPAGQLGLFD
ncbi:MAG: SOS response-associated peptidase [Myxococcales bacterium]|nr:SOS response-associated peptidase [Myxococcales bacterium]